MIEAQGDRAGCLYDDGPHCDIIRGSEVYKAGSKIIEGPLIISIGSNKVRHLISERYALKYATAIYPAATVSQYVVIQGAYDDNKESAETSRHLIRHLGENGNF